MELALRRAEEPVSVWTIGHSTHPMQEFVDLLRANQIQALADVRRFPGSRRLPQFGQENFAPALREAGIQYMHFPELGGRRQPARDSRNLAWRNPSFRGYADYMETEVFRAGIDRLLGLARGSRTSVMCAEALWWRCHRALISDYLLALGHRVVHILSDGKTQPHPFTSAARIEGGRLCYPPQVTQPELGLS